MRVSSRQPALVAFLSPSGWGNLGDAAIIESLIDAVRRRQPDARLVAFTLNAAGTAAQHGIEAHTLLGYSRPFYPMVEAGGAGGASTGEDAAPADTTADTTAGNGGLLQSIRRLPLPRRARAWLGAPLRIVSEARHLQRSRRRLRGASMLVVAGGGQLDAAWGGPFGQPYALWRWSRLARREHAPFVVLSVGTGTLDRLSRRLIRPALAAARYRSFRDARSRAMLELPELVGEDPVVPDLAYGLAVAPKPPAEHATSIIGISPMNYCHPYHWPTPDPEAYRRHVSSFAEIARRLLETGHGVVLFTTDSDEPAVQDTVELIGPLDAARRARFEIADTSDLGALFDVLERVDVVVAARLHGVILAHVAHRPALAVSHERKVRQLMADMGQERYCLDITSFDADVAVARIQDLVDHQAEVVDDLAARVAGFRGLVNQQYDAVLGDGVAEPGGAP